MYRTNISPLTVIPKLRASSGDVSGSTKLKEIFGLYFWYLAINFFIEDLSFKISYFENSVSKIKTKATNDLLSMVIIGSKNISIYDAFKKDKQIETILLKNMGIVFPINTIFNENIGKKSLVLDLLYL